MFQAWQVAYGGTDITKTPITLEDAGRAQRNPARKFLPTLLIVDCGVKLSIYVGRFRRVLDAQMLELRQILVEPPARHL